MHSLQYRPSRRCYDRAWLDGRRGDNHQVQPLASACRQRWHLRNGPDALLPVARNQAPMLGAELENASGCVQDRLVELAGRWMSTVPNVPVPQPVHTRRVRICLKESIKLLFAQVKHLPSLCHMLHGCCRSRSAVHPLCKCSYIRHTTS